MRYGALAIIAALAVAAACARERTGERMITWQTDVAPIVAEACVSCHGGADPKGSYSLESYVAALGSGTDATPNLIAKDPMSRFLARLEESDHQAYLGNGATKQTRKETLEQWVAAGIPYSFSTAHSPGNLNPADPGFHGNAVRDQGYRLEPCQKCHGPAYDGGPAGVSCWSCHTSGPESCATCHGTAPDGAPPPGLAPGSSGGAHARHLSRTSTRTLAVSCGDCHPVPESYRAAGHADGKIDIAFGARARAREASPVFRAETKSCSGVACHRAGLEGGAVSEPAWFGGPLPGACTACHGAPPVAVRSGVPHAQVARCELCHPPLPAVHTNGTVDVLPATAACNVCHAGPPNPVPFRDTEGQSDPTRATVGAHDRHLSAGAFTAGFTCDVCHELPTSASGLAHVDGRPAEVVFSGAAVGTGVDARWDPGARTCTVWCHAATLPGGPATSPVWNEPSAEIVCGSCHPLPPGPLATGEPHPLDCGRCHGSVIGSDLRWVDPSKHVNGRVEISGS